MEVYKKKTQIGVSLRQVIFLHKICLPLSCVSCLFMCRSAISNQIFYHQLSVFLLFTSKVGSILFLSSPFQKMIFSKSSISNKRPELAKLTVTIVSTSLPLLAIDLSLSPFLETGANEPRLLFSTFMAFNVQSGQTAGDTLTLWCTGRFQWQQHEILKQNARQFYIYMLCVRVTP